MSAGYIVYHPVRGFLRLLGPFEYTRWAQKIEHATPMPWSKAHAYAALVDGEVHGA